MTKSTRESLGHPIGMFHQLPEELGGVVVGREVINESFVQAMRKHGMGVPFDLFCPALQTPLIEERLGLRPGESPDATGIRIHDRRTLLHLPANHRIAAWHDFQFDTYRPFALRQRFSHPFPITLVHHTLSYPDLLHSHFLRLLLSAPRSYDSVICTSVAARQSMARLLEHVADSFQEEYGTPLAYRGRLDVIPLAVDTERFQPRPKENLRDQFGLPRDAFVLLWIGRLSALDKADLFPLVQLFAELHAEYPEKRMLLVCAGADRPAERYGDHLKQYAAQLGVAHALNVRAIRPEDAHLLHAAADVFVSPVDNVQETFGLTVIEAMACGVPAVVSDWNGYRDTVRHAETGFLIPTAGFPCDGDLAEAAFLGDAPFEHLTQAQSVVVDLTALKEALRTLLKDTEFRQKMGAQARRHVVEQFSWQVVLPRYLELWQELATECSNAQPSPEPTMAYARPIYAKAFEHYATTSLDDECVVHLADLGRRLVRGEAILPLVHSSRIGGMQPDLLQRVMRGVVHAAENQRTLTIGRIADVLAKNLPGQHARDVVRRHVLWLLKYGYVSLDSPGGDELASHGASPPKKMPSASPPPEAKLAAEAPPSTESTFHVTVLHLLEQILRQEDWDVEQRLYEALRLLSKYRSQLIGTALAEANGLIVRAGPLAGLQMPSTVAEGCFVAKLLGTYEQDLHPLLSSLPQRNYQMVLNLGCAEGYYAVGLARLLPRTVVHAFDTGPSAQSACADLARDNGVADRVQVAATFSPEDFSRYTGSRVLVLCDIEGDEVQLLDVERSPALCDFDLLVEVHDDFVPGASALLRERFAPSHTIHEISFGPRTPADFAELRDLEHLDQLLCVWEWRLANNFWLWLEAKSHSASTTTRETPL